MPRNRTHSRPFKSRLALLRGKRQLTLDQIAAECGCHKSQVSRWERLVGEPAHEHRMPYAEALGISVGQLGTLLFDERRRKEALRG